MTNRLKIKFNNHNQQSPFDSPNINPYLTLPYIGTPSIKFHKRIALLFRNRLGTDIKIIYQTFKIISCFNLNFPLPAFFCSNVVYQYTCSCDKNTAYIYMTTRLLCVRIENHLSNNQSSSTLLSNPIANNAKPAEKQCQQNKTLHY